MVWIKQTLLLRLKFAHTVQYRVIILHSVHDYLRGCVSRLKTPLKKNVKSTWQSVNLINMFHVGSRSFCITQCLSLKSEIYFSLYTQDLKIIILCQFDFNMNRNRRNIVNDTYISDSISKYIYGNKANHLVCFN